MFERTAPVFLVHGGGLAVVIGIVAAWGADLAATAILPSTSARVTTALLLIAGAAVTLLVQSFLMLGWRRFLRSQSGRARHLLPGAADIPEASRATALPADRRPQGEPAGR